MSEIAKAVKARVRDKNHHDPNITQRERRPGSSFTSGSLNFRESIKTKEGNVAIEILFNGIYAELIVHSPGLDLGVWSINQPDYYYAQEQSTKGIREVFGLPLYTRGRDSVSFDAEQLLQSKAAKELLDKIELGPQESIHFYKDSAVYYAKTTDSALFLCNMRIFTEFVRTLKPLHTPISDIPEVLPQEFSELQYLVGRWAISDDSDRSDAIDRATVDDLQGLVRRVEPRFREINAYLDTHQDENAALLTSLAETAAEAKLKLDKIELQKS